MDWIIFPIKSWSNERLMVGWWISNWNCFKNNVFSTKIHFILKQNNLNCRKILKNFEKISNFTYKIVSRNIYGEKKTQTGAPPVWSFHYSALPISATQPADPHLDKGC